MKNILVLLILFINLFAFDRDSLIQKLKTEKNLENTQLIDLYYSIGDIYNSEKEFPFALEYLSKGLKICNKEIDKAKFMHKIGQVYVDSTNYSLALINLDKALKIYLEEESLKEISNTYSLIGMCHGLTNDLLKAIESFESALKYNIQLKDSGAIGQSYFNIGLADYFLGRYNLATEYYIKSLKVREELADTNALVASLTSLGETLRVREKYSDAMRYYQQALKLKEGVNSKQTLAYIYSEIGLIYKSEKNFKSALAYMDTSLQISIDGKYKRGIATLYTYMAGIEKELGNDNKALDLYLKSIDQYHKIGFEQGIIESQIAIAEIYKNKRNYKRAINLLSIASDKARSNNLLEERTEAAKLLYEINKETNNPATLLSLELYLVLKDSLFNLEKEKQINEIETKYETEKKEKQIEVLDQATKIQQQQLDTQQYLIAGGITLTVLIVFVTVLYMRQSRLKSQVQVEQERMRLLRSQMNPHFIYNALAAIQSYILKNNPIESASYISRFARLMRIVLESSREDFIPLSEEIEFLRIYLELQQLRFKDKFEFSIISDEKITENEIMIPPMLTQPVVENAVEHGMRQLKNGNGRIEIEYKNVEEKLIITVTDNGPGLSVKNVKSEEGHKSLATKIMNERLENIEKLHGIKIELDLSEPYPNEVNKGNRIVFKVPWRN